MTLKEVRMEAKKYGYYLAKKPKPYERLKPCPVCGNNRRDHFNPVSVANLRYGMRCTKCGFTVLGTSSRDVHKKWNEECSKPM